jgi:hypothetical protein
VLSYDTRLEPPHQEPHHDLVRQVYLLSGDPERSRQLALRAAAAGQLHARRYGSDEALEYARAGQEPCTGPAQRPSDVPAGAGFATLLVAHMGFPCGKGTLTVHRDRATATVALPVYLP